MLALVHRDSFIGEESIIDIFRWGALNLRFSTTHLMKSSFDLVTIFEFDITMSCLLHSSLFAH